MPGPAGCKGTGLDVEAEDSADSTAGILPLISVASVSWAGGLGG